MPSPVTAAGGACTRSVMRRYALAALALFALLACKMFKKEEPAPSALPPPEPPPAETAAATPTEPSAAEPTPDTPTPTGTVAPKKTDAGAKDAGAKDASASADAATPSDAGGGKSAACASKCQGVLQACLTPGKTEAGMPTFADPTKCQAAFDECAKACK